jgi:ankyrin repeat protein
MPTNSEGERRSLPERPNLRHLKNQAKDLFNQGGAKSLTSAQFKVARMYGFASWAKLRAHVEGFEEIGALKQAIDANDLERVKAVMSKNRELHTAPLGYNQNGPLTLVAECRVPWRPPTPVRLAMAQWMIDNGSDVHQGGDGPLMRAALRGDRIRMMELLLANGADVNAEWNGDFPIIFSPCETVDPVSLEWLLDHGANPNCARDGRKYPVGALDYLIQSYWRAAELAECIQILLKAGATTRYNVPAVLDMLRGRLDLLARHLDADPALVHRRFPELDFGGTGMRRLSLNGGTLLHVAAEYCNTEAARLLLERGADVNARTAVDNDGVGGETPIFHSASQFDDKGLEVTRLLLDFGADLTIRAKLPGQHDDPRDFVEGDALTYASRFPGQDESHAGRLPNHKTITLLREWALPASTE